ncbi:hypothetical protein Tco_0586913, partial [Tanacetum coccineum]
MMRGDSDGGMNMVVAAMAVKKVMVVVVVWQRGWNGDDGTLSTSYLCFVWCLLWWGGGEVACGGRVLVRGEMVVRRAQCGVTLVMANVGGSGWLDDWVVLRVEWRWRSAVVNGTNGEGRVAGDGCGGGGVMMTMRGSVGDVVTMVLVEGGVGSSGGEDGVG